MNTTRFSKVWRYQRR